MSTLFTLCFQECARKTLLRGTNNTDPKTKLALALQKICYITTQTLVYRLNFFQSISALFIFVSGALAKRSQKIAALSRHSVQRVRHSSFLGNTFLPRSFGKFEAVVPASFLFQGEERRSFFRSFFRSFSISFTFYHD